MKCPRCGQEKSRLEYEGKEDGNIVWRIYYCTVCCHSWRDSEPDHVIQFDKRDPDFRVDPNHLDRYPVILKP